MEDVVDLTSADRQLRPPIAAPDSIAELRAELRTLRTDLTSLLGDISAKVLAEIRAVADRVVEVERRQAATATTSLNVRAQDGSEHAF
jgi:hypothetical protein